MADDEDLEATTPPDLYPCSICSRTFKAESLDKHYKSCEKNASKKRKIFNSTKQRIQGTDLAEYLPSLLKTRKAETVSPRKKPQSNWKAQHLEFLKAIRAARGVTEGFEGDSTSMDAITRPSNTEPCPTCDRNFGPKAWERHIEWCREQKARLPSKSQVSNETNIAKERLAARTKYRAPLTKTKRSIVREKYAGIGDKPPLSGEKPSGNGEISRKSSVNVSLSAGDKQTSMPNIKSLHGRSQANSVSIAKESTNAVEFQRTSNRSSNRQYSPTKRNLPQSLSSAKSTESSNSAAARSRALSPQKVKRDVKETPVRVKKELFHGISPKAARGDSIRGDKRNETANVLKGIPAVKSLNRTQSKRIDSKSKPRIPSEGDGEDENERVSTRDAGKARASLLLRGERDTLGAEARRRELSAKRRRNVIEQKIFKAKSRLVQSPRDEQSVPPTPATNIRSLCQIHLPTIPELPRSVALKGHCRPTMVVRKRRPRAPRYLVARGRPMKNPLNRQVMSPKKVNVGVETFQETSIRPFNENMKPCTIPLRKHRCKKSALSKSKGQGNEIKKEFTKTGLGVITVCKEVGFVNEMVDDNTFKEERIYKAENVSTNSLHGSSRLEKDKNKFPNTILNDRVKVPENIKPVWYEKDSEKFMHDYEKQVEACSSRLSSNDTPQGLGDFDSLTERFGELAVNTLTVNIDAVESSNSTARPSDCTESYFAARQFVENDDGNATSRLDERYSDHFKRTSNDIGSNPIASAREMDVDWVILNEAMPSADVVRDKGSDLFTPRFGKRFELSEETKDLTFECDAGETERSRVGDIHNFVNPSFDLNQDIQKLSEDDLELDIVTGNLPAEVKAASGDSETLGIVIDEDSLRPTQIIRCNTFVIEKADQFKCDVSPDVKVEVASEDVCKKETDTVTVMGSSHSSKASVNDDYRKKTRRALPQNIIDILNNKGNCVENESASSDDEANESSDDEANFTCNESRPELTTLKPSKSVWCRHNEEFKFADILDVNGKSNHLAQEKDVRPPPEMQNRVELEVLYEAKRYDVRDIEGEESDPMEENSVTFLRGAYHTESIYQRIPSIECERQGGDYHNLGDESRGDEESGNRVRDNGAEDDGQNDGEQGSGDEFSGGEVDGSKGNNGEENGLENVGKIKDVGRKGGDEGDVENGGEESISGEYGDGKGGVESCDIQYGAEDCDVVDKAECPRPKTYKVYSSKSSRLLLMRANSKASRPKNPNMHGVKSEGDLYQDSNVESKCHAHLAKETRSVPPGAWRTHANKSMHAKKTRGRSRQTTTYDGRRGDYFDCKDPTYRSLEGNVSDSGESSGFETEESLGSSRLELLSFQEVEENEAMSVDLEEDEVPNCARGTARPDCVKLHSTEETDNEIYVLSGKVVQLPNITGKYPDNYDNVSMATASSSSSKAASRISISSGDECDNDGSSVSEIESPKKFIRYWGCNLSVSFEENRAGELLGDLGLKSNRQEESSTSSSTIGYVPNCDRLLEDSVRADGCYDPNLWGSSSELEMESERFQCKEARSPRHASHTSIASNPNSSRHHVRGSEHKQVLTGRKTVHCSKSSPVLSPNSNYHGGKLSDCRERNTYSLRGYTGDGHPCGGSAADLRTRNVGGASDEEAGDGREETPRVEARAIGSRRRGRGLRKVKTLRGASQALDDASATAGCTGLEQDPQIYHCSGDTNSLELATNSVVQDRPLGKEPLDNRPTCSLWGDQDLKVNNFSARSKRTSPKKANDSARKSRSDCVDLCLTKPLESRASVNGISMTGGSPKRQTVAAAVGGSHVAANKISVTHAVDLEESSGSWDSIPDRAKDGEEWEIKSLPDITSLHLTDLDGESNYPSPDGAESLVHSPNKDTQGYLCGYSRSQESIPDFTSVDYLERKRSILEVADIVLEHSFELSLDIPISEENSPTSVHGRTTPDKRTSVSTRSIDSRRSSPKHHVGMKIGSQVMSKKEYMQMLRSNRKRKSPKQKVDVENATYAVSEIIIPLKDSGRLRKSTGHAIPRITNASLEKRKANQSKPNNLLVQCPLERNSSRLESAASSRKPVEDRFWEQQANVAEKASKKVLTTRIPSLRKPQKSSDESFWVERAKSGSKTLLTAVLTAPLSPVRREVSKRRVKLPPLREVSNQQVPRTRLPGLNGNYFSPSLPNFTLFLNSSDAPPTEVYDPFASAKRQLMELLAQGEASPKSVSNSSSVASSPVVPRVLETSPTSAFSRYTSPPPPPAESEFVPLDNRPVNEDDDDFGDLVISGRSVANRPASKSSSIMSESNENLNNIMDIAASLSSLSICSLEDIHLRNGNVLDGGRSTRRNSKYRDKLENAALSLRRSVSMFHPGADLDELGPSDFEDLLHDPDDDFPSPVYPNASFSLSSIGIKPPSLRNQNLYADFDDFHDDRTAEDTGKRNDDRKRSGRSDEKEEEFSSPENVSSSHRSSGNKFNADSAYSSLNRKSPLLATRGEPHQSEVVDSTTAHFERLHLSSSGSDSSLPPIQVVQAAPRKELTSPSLKRMSPPRVHPSPQPTNQKMSKFCHECGSKFPLTEAKFCCECGVRRLLV